MTDKQIIIGGVDVSGCDFTIERDGKIKCECTHATGFGVICDCEGWKTCDYKNYKRKEQECKNVQSELIEANKQVIYLAKQLDQLQKSNEELQKENEKLKKQVCGLRPELKHLINEICHKYDIEAKTYHEKIVEIIHSLDDYKQALDNIEEILKQGIKIHDDIIVSKQILQKARGRKW